MTCGTHVCSYWKVVWFALRTKNKSMKMITVALYWHRKVRLAEQEEGSTQCGMWKHTRCARWQVGLGFGPNDMLHTNTCTYTQRPLHLHRGQEFLDSFLANSFFIPNTLQPLCYGRVANVRPQHPMMKPQISTFWQFWCRLHLQCRIGNWTILHKWLSFQCAWKSLFRPSPSSLAFVEITIL